MTVEQGWCGDRFVEHGAGDGLAVLGKHGSDVVVTLRKH